MKAIVTSITGHDGAYLAQLLLEKGYTVIGTHRRASSVNFWRIEELDIKDYPNLQLAEYDLTDLSSRIRLLLSGMGATEVYKLAATKLCRSVVRATGHNRRNHGWWRGKSARSDTNRQFKDPDLPGLNFRNVRQGAGRPTGRIDAVLSA